MGPVKSGWNRPINLRSLKDVYFICVIIGAYLIFTHLGGFDKPGYSGGPEVGAGFILLVAIPCFWVLRWGWRLGGYASDQLKTATTPLPTPDQIRASLEAEWRRPATVQEVAAVQQMLTNERNQALFNSGMALGAIYLLRHGGTHP
jgi:hypothetical protein